MADDSNYPQIGRRLLPGTAQMSAYNMSQPIAYQQQRETQKNYVFVDEHNRHKRLKVMRACEGCRRRKIKCDAATTNTWPCSACIRLKLHCVRPNGYDGAADQQVYEPPRPQFEPSHIQDGFRQQLPLHDQQLLASAQKLPSVYPPHAGGAFGESAGLYQYDQAGTSHYTTVPPPVNVVDQPYAQQTAFPTPPMQQPPPPLSQGQRQETPPDTYSQEQYGQLADLLGSLKVNEAGTAPYLNNKMRQGTREEEEPAVEDADDYKSVLPPLAAGPGLKIRIPPELMPDEETIMHYFDLYFNNAHPYVPVLDKVQFYQQWQTNRESISPLLIEAIFSIAGRLADEPAQGQQWLALATRHADSFMDVPRLSTLQALMIILKAREQAPKKGYYYRSWMSIVQAVQMAKDLGLDEHYGEHQAGHSCGSTQSECLLKTRIWQCLFVCEVMIGSPQARTDLQVDIDEVDFNIPRSGPGGDESEYHVSRNFTYLARIVRNIGRMNKAYSRLRKKTGWGVSPEFLEILPEINAWLMDLPADMSVTYPPDGSAPWLPSPFVGNMHTYHYLSIILYHRPQLAVLDQHQAEGQWKHSMRVSYEAAKKLCKLQEAMLQTFGLPGLQCMQRGINFTIYAVLACVVLHLVALTSPDPELNADAREYFTRHMRVLETCMAAWPMEDMQKQVDSVRQAFSADVRKPFVLKPSFPYGSPHSGTQPSPVQAHPQAALRTGSMDHPHTQQQAGHHHIDTRAASYSNHPITPPISAGPVDSKSGGSPGLQSAAVGAVLVSQAPSHGLALTAEAPSAWNPSRIFDQWNTSFGVAEVPTVQDIQAVHAQLPPAVQQQAGPPNQMPGFTAAAAHAAIPTFVTPSMWQESVASVYEGGLKRSWDYDSAVGVGVGVGGDMMVKRR